MTHCTQNFKSLATVVRKNRCKAVKQIPMLVNCYAVIFITHKTCLDMSCILSENLSSYNKTGH